MMFQAIWGRLRSLARRKPRVLCYGLILAGGGLVAVLSVDLALLATASTPGQRASSRPVPGGGTLVICGGGTTPPAVRDRFLELAGGSRARIVVIPTAHRIADTPAVNTVLDSWKARRVASVQCLHTRSRLVADDPAFVQPLTAATGVWLSGGLQSSLTAVYLGTEVERQLKALLERGGVIGGTSAGAAVMTRVMITQGKTTAELGKGFDFLPGAVIDQHFLRRNRLERLLSVVGDHPKLVGLGIDERTALVVNIRSRVATVIGDSYVVACTAGPVDERARLQILRPGDEVNLTRLQEEEDPSLAIAAPLDLDAS
jgi:cyanophycinase